MDFSLSDEMTSRRDAYIFFLEEKIKPELNAWYRSGSMPKSMFSDMGHGGWLGFREINGTYSEDSMLQQSLIMEEIAKMSSGVAIAMLAHASLGLKGLALFGTEAHVEKHLKNAAAGDTILCAGNTENMAGSDVANIQTKAEKVSGGWVLNGAKSYVTNGILADYALVTAITDPKAKRTRRLSLFFVDLAANGVSRKKLNKQTWIPSDLTRIQMKDVFVPDADLMGERGRGLSHILEIFTNSRLTISALTLGTAEGAFKLAMDHARQRRIFGDAIVNFQAKSFEIADLYARIESARLMVYKACWSKDQGESDFGLHASMAKYLTVEIARQVCAWSADLFGAASTVFEHPIHKYPMDVWGSSLGEGTQDVQKLIIFREVMKRMESENV